jgi:hypothetical protein
MFLLGIQPLGGTRVAATPPVQPEVTFEPPGRLILGSVQAVAVEDGRAYVLTYNGLLIADVSDPTNLRKLGEWYFPADSATLGLKVATAGGIVYLSTTNSGVYILDARDPTQPRVLGIARIQGYVGGVAVSGNFLYATTNLPFLEVIEVSDPTTPRRVGRVLTGPGYPLAVAGNFVYVATGQAGLLVVDVSDPRSPQRIVYVSLPSSAIDVVVSGRWAFVVSEFDGLRILDVSNPGQPQEISFFGQGFAARKVVKSCQHSKNS